MKNYTIYIISLLIVILTSCQINKNQGMASFTLDDFKPIQLSQPNTIECDSLFMGKPGSIHFHPDNFLLIADRRNVKLLHIIDLEDNSSVMKINPGRAQNELLSVWDVTIKGNDVYLSSIYENKLLKLHYNSLNREFDFNSSIQFPQQFLRCIPYDSGYLTYASASSNDRFYMWDNSINVVDTIGNFPVDGIIGEVPLHNGVLQSDLSVHENKIVASYKGIDYIDIYKNLSLCKRIHGPVLKDVEVKEREFSNGSVVTSLSPDMSIFNRIIATDNGFYVGYVGYVSNGKDIPTSEDMSIKQILHFTWDGKPDYVYILDKSIQDFAIDTESGVVYCLTASPEPDIISYML